MRVPFTCHAHVGELQESQPPQPRDLRHRPPRVTRPRAVGAAGDARASQPSDAHGGRVAPDARPLDPVCGVDRVARRRVRPGISRRGVAAGDGRADGLKGSVVRADAAPARQRHVDRVKRAAGAGRAAVRQGGEVGGRLKHKGGVAAVAACAWGKCLGFRVDAHAPSTCALLIAQGCKASPYARRPWPAASHGFQRNQSHTTQQPPHPGSCRP